MNTQTTNSVLSSAPTEIKPTKQLLFSLITGDIYTIDADEYKNMDKYQIPLLKKPSEGCSRCFGRMHDGYNTTIKAYVLCKKCVNKCVDFKLLKSETIDIETIKNA